MSDFDEAYAADPAVFGAPYADLLDTVGDRGPGRVLDLGCGQGRNAVALAGLGHRVTAVDSSVVGVRQAVAGASGPGGVAGVVADLADFPIRGRYDLVLADMVLHGLDGDDEVDDLVERMTAAVAPGGAVYVVVPDPGPLVERVTAALLPWTVTVRQVQHRLTSGEHAGEYTFVAVIGERPPG